MPLVVPDLGEVELLRLMLKTALAVDEPLSLRLYANDYAPNRQSVLANFTAASFDGYAPITLARAGWSAPATVGGIAQSTHGAAPAQWIAASGSQTCYGYYVTDAAGAVVYWAERFPAPLTVTTAVPILVVPVMRLRSESQPAP